MKLSKHLNIFIMIKQHLIVRYLTDGRQKTRSSLAFRFTVDMKIDEGKLVNKKNSVVETDPTLLWPPEPLRLLDIDNGTIRLIGVMLLYEFVCIVKLYEIIYLCGPLFLFVLKTFYVFLCLAVFRSHVY